MCVRHLKHFLRTCPQGWQWLPVSAPCSQFPAFSQHRPWSDHHLHAQCMTGTEIQLWFLQVMKGTFTFLLAYFMQGCHQWKVYNNEAQNSRHSQTNSPLLSKIFIKTLSWSPIIRLLLVLVVASLSSTVAASVPSNSSSVMTKNGTHCVVSPSGVNVILRRNSVVKSEPPERIPQMQLIVPWCMSTYYLLVFSANTCSWIHSSSVEFNDGVLGDGSIWDFHTDINH